MGQITDKSWDLEANPHFHVVAESDFTAEKSEAIQKAFATKHIFIKPDPNPTADPKAKEKEEPDYTGFQMEELKTVAGGSFMRPVTIHGE